MNGSTPAIRALIAAGIEHRLHRFEHLVPGDAPDVGFARAAALAMGVSEDRVFKTLVVRADDRYAVALLPASQTLSMRKVARALDARSADMAGAGDAQRMTGYVVGGISPFGQKRRLATIAHETIDEFPTVFVSAGRRGWDVEIAPAHLVAALTAVVADVVIP